MDICCPRCGGPAEPAGHEDARAFYQCPGCDRVWATHISAVIDRGTLHAAAPIRALVADDSPEMLGLLSAWLEDEGCLVIAVGSGREALDAALSYRPQVMFLDVILPGPDGFQVCQALSTRPGAPGIVLMTGMPNQHGAIVWLVFWQNIGRKLLQGFLRPGLQIRSDDRNRVDPVNIRKIDLLYHMQECNSGLVQTGEIHRIL